MDTTPSPKMFTAMTKLVDSMCGEEPSKLLTGAGATAIRTKRAAAFDVLHLLVALCMREGVNRAIKEAQLRQAGILTLDGPDRSAVSRAIDDAQAGKNRVILNG